MSYDTYLQQNPEFHISGTVKTDIGFGNRDYLYEDLPVVLNLEFNRLEGDELENYWVNF